MSEREVERLRVLEQVSAGAMTQVEAAAILKLMSRQVRRLQQRLALQGGAGLVHKLRGRASNRRLDPALARSVQQLLRDHYPDFGPTFAAEKLQERHGIVISAESVRKLMSQAGLWRPKLKRLAPIHPIRARRPCRGELIQIDGYPMTGLRIEAPDAACWCSSMMRQAS